MTTTLGSLIEATGHDVLDHLDRDTLVPIITGLQCQGDVVVIPMRDGKVAGALAVPLAGMVLVRGESGGNTHLLLSSPGVSFAPAKGGRESLDLGTLVVVDHATAYVHHPEHGYLGIGSGQYLIRRQRQMAEIARVVAD